MARHKGQYRKSVTDQCARLPAAVTHESRISMRCALCTNRSRMPSVGVGSLPIHESGGVDAITSPRRKFEQLFGEGHPGHHSAVVIPSTPRTLITRSWFEISKLTLCETRPQPLR